MMSTKNKSKVNKKKESCPFCKNDYLYETNRAMSYGTQLMNYCSMCSMTWYFSDKKLWKNAKKLLSSGIKKLLPVIVDNK